MPRPSRPWGKRSGRRPIPSFWPISGTDSSLRHILALKKQGLYHGNTSRACSGASSVIAKKVLLMKAVQEDFGVTMSPEQSAALTTVTQLTDYILAQRAGERA